jgi:hypothetical protein
MRLSVSYQVFEDEPPDSSQTACQRGNFLDAKHIDVLHGAALNGIQHWATR